ncbi:hypothetical protein GCM10010965_14360 [Caldalkalibacillus thermarum]|uniref:hypothetical protein n=1 Tax=Caldalkalibacillus thermarum TaxID=296745 RepID=UPI001666382E|nr:hypothetical protein [Caldalkalibacillus thermarum]GGK22576.1 hypothetical protein GCM10010965_14360 [Caldalkalibacillus thermarum]
MSAPATKPVETVEEAVQLANEIERLEAVLKSMKAQLKAFVDENGPVETHDAVWGYTVSVSWVFEPESLKELAQELAVEGENPWQYLSLSATAIKKLGWDESVLSRYGKKRETKRFVSRKK